MTINKITARCKATDEAAGSDAALRALGHAPRMVRHGQALSIGMTTVQRDACFGLYADREALPDADGLAGHIDAAIDELLELSR